MVRNLGECERAIDLACQVTSAPRANSETVSATPVTGVNDLFNGAVKYTATRATVVSVVRRAALTKGRVRALRGCAFTLRPCPGPAVLSHPAARNGAVLGRR
ncbi:hypothetical protein GCM10010187_28990 [Actinomadura coerulea]|nr:hypothetical protein GCM10010187_28990 [Actinomadura coerulea]